MPPWSIEQGGALNDFQIEQLVLLITSTFSPKGWEFALEEANHADAFTPHKYLTSEVDEEATTIELSDVDGIEPDQEIRIGAETTEEPYEVLLVTDVDEDANTLEVERAAAGTDAIPHESGAEVYRGPIPPGTTITGDPESPGFPPCGQKAAAAAPTDGGDGGAATDLPATVEMGDNYFQVGTDRNPDFKVPAGQTVNVTLQNIGSAPHNLRIAGGDFEFDTTDDIVSDPDLIPGGQNGSIAVTLNAGTYDYRCDFHPVDMAGTITAE
jgi:plastocyanin